MHTDSTYRFEPFVTVKTYSTDTLIGEKNKKLIDSIGSNSASVGGVPDATHYAELVILATPWNATRSALQSAGNLSDKIVVDCTNPLKEDLSRLVIGHPKSAQLY